MFGVWLRSLRQEWLQLDFAVGNGLRAKIIERPARWMSREALQELVAQLRTVAAATVSKGELEYGVLTGSEDRLSNTIITLVYDAKTRQPIAFNALAIMPVALRGQPVEVLHLGLVIVDPTARSKGLSWILYGLTCALLSARNQFRDLWVSNVTQVPAVIGMVSDTFTDVFPRPGNSVRRSFDHLVLARQIMAHHRSAFGVGGEAEFDEDRFVIKNAYTGGSDNLKKSFAEATKHRQAIYNEMCQNGLDYERGDDFLQIGRVELSTLTRYLSKDVPRGLLAIVVPQLLFSFAHSVFLPALYWFSAGRSWGTLRPWPK
jgi:hypothetical protein